MSRRQSRGSSRSSMSFLRKSALAVMAIALASSGGVIDGTSPFMMVDASSAASAALSALKTMDYRYFVAGGTCAAFSHGITTPIDVVKTKLQANPKKYEGKSLVGATIEICKDKEEGGPSALLKGLGPTVIGYGIEGAMKFGVYEILKPVIIALLGGVGGASGLDGDTIKLISFVIASFAAGTVAAILLVPMESLRIKQVTDASYATDSIATGLPRIIKEDGFFVMMSGVWAMLAKQVPYTFGKQVSFDIVAKFLYSVIGGISVLAGNPAVMKWVVSVLSAFCASIAACLCSQPGDMILTETYSGGVGNKKGRGNKKGSSSGKPENFGKVVRALNARGGIPEFFRGTKARIVHVGLIITSQLVVYDLVKQMLGLPATGSH